MVTIRLTRRGATNTPFYHVVVTDSRKRQGGKSLEQVGFFNPQAGEERGRAQARSRSHRLLGVQGRAAVRPREEPRHDVPQGERGLIDCRGRRERAPLRRGRQIGSGARRARLAAGAVVHRSPAATVRMAPLASAGSARSGTRSEVAGSAAPGKWLDRADRGCRGSRCRESVDRADDPRRAGAAAEGRGTRALPRRPGRVSRRRIWKVRCWGWSIISSTRRATR